MSATLLVQEGHEVLLAAATVVILRFIATGGEEFEGGESLDVVLLAELGVLLVITVNVGDNALLK